MPIQTTHIHAHTKHPTFTHKHTTHITDAHVCTHTQSIHTTHARILHMHTLHSARTHTYTCKHTYHVHVHLNTPRHTAYSHAHHIHTHKHTHLHLEHQIAIQKLTCSLVVKKTQKWVRMGYQFDSHFSKNPQWNKNMEVQKSYTLKKGCGCGQDINQKWEISTALWETERGSE